MAVERSGGLELSVDGHQAMLGWQTPTPADFVTNLRDFLDENLAALRDLSVRRIVALVDPDDRAALLAMHRNGFLREGLHVGFIADQDGVRDVFSYAKDVSSEAPHFSTVMNSVLPTHRVIAHVLIRDESGRILLEHVRYKSDWELPGGIVEPNEAPRVGAQREVFEELGVHIKVGAPLVVDWMPPYLGWSDALEFIFDGGVMAASDVEQFTLATDELAAVHWVAPDRIAEHVTELSARRIAAILSSEGFYYSEDGSPVSDVL